MIKRVSRNIMNKINTRRNSRKNSRNSKGSGRSGGSGRLGRLAKMSRRNKLIGSVVVGSLIAVMAGAYLKNKNKTSPKPPIAAVTRPELSEEETIADKLKFIDSENRTILRIYDELNKFDASSVNKHKFPGFDKNKHNVAICGRLRSGKSTIVNAIMGKGDNDSGAALINDNKSESIHDIKDYPISKTDIVLWDFPAWDTKNYPLEGYFQSINFEQFDEIIITYDTYITHKHATAAMYRWCIENVKNNVPVKLVRTKADGSRRHYQHILETNDIVTIKRKMVDEFDDEITKYCPIAKNQSYFVSMWDYEGKTGTMDEKKFVDSVINYKTQPQTPVSLPVNVPTHSTTVTHNEPDNHITMLFNPGDIKSDKYNIIICGPSKSGKSTMVNAFIKVEDGSPGSADDHEIITSPSNDKDGKVINIKSTNIKHYSVPGTDVVLWDLPGWGTKEYPYETYGIDVVKQLRKFDRIIIVYDSGLDANIAELYKMLTKMEVPVTVVRTKADKEIEAKIHKYKQMTPEMAVNSAKNDFGKESEDLDKNLADSFYVSMWDYVEKKGQMDEIKFVEHVCSFKK